MNFPIQALNVETCRPIFRYNIKSVNLIIVFPLFRKWVEFFLMNSTNLLFRELFRVSSFVARLASFANMENRIPLRSKGILRDRNCIDDLVRTYSKPEKMVVAIEGNIGAGKSTLMNQLKSRSDVAVVMEPVDDWCNVKGHNMLELLYKDPKRWCFTFNSNAMLARMKMHCDLGFTQPIKIIERSLYATRHVFVEHSHKVGDIVDIELAMLDELFQSLRQYCDVKLDKIIYLRAEPETCLRRISKRGRKEEADLSLEFLTSLHNLYDEWLLHSKIYDIPVITIDANQHIPDNLASICEDVCRSTRQLSY